MGSLLFLVACLITYGSLYPFEFSTAGADRMAFDAFLSSWSAPSSQGDILRNIVIFIPFGFLGQLALPPRRGRAARALLLLALGLALAAGLQAAQLYLPARIPALSDVIWNMAGLAAGAVFAFPSRVQARLGQHWRWGPWLGNAVRFVFALGLVLGGLTWLRDQPQPPYDLSALLADRGGIFERLMFALGLLSIGLGAGIVAHRLSTGRRPYLRLPGWALLAALASYALFYFSLSKSAMAALTGPSVFLTRLRVDRVLGDWGADAVAAIGVDRAQTVLAITEPFVRFAALTMPLTVTLALFGAALWQLELFPAVSGIRRLIFLVFCLLIYAVSALPILLLCKFIAFDVPSDQNLSALVTGYGGYGLGGGLYLYLLLIVLTFSMAWLAWSLRRPRPARLVVSLLLTVLALPAGWWLAQHGIAPEMKNSGLPVSPLGMLLAPESNGQGADQSLLPRWFVGQGVVMALLLLGAFIPSGPAKSAA